MIGWIVPTSLLACITPTVNDGNFQAGLIV